MVQQLTAKERLKLNELLQAVEIISEVDKDMPMMMVKALLLLMIEEGRGPNEIAGQMGVVPAVASRHISDLGEQNRRREAGHKLVEQKMDVNDRRYRRAWLTPKGYGVRARILRALGV
jgi:DNA-binding MarR family transcriptional regulator